MGQRARRRTSGRGYARYLRSVTIGGVLLLMAGIVALGLRGASSRPPGPSGPVDPDDARLVAHGRAVYEQSCATCHGTDLEGQPGWDRAPARGPSPATPLDGSGRTWHYPDSQLLAIVRDGGQPFSPAGYLNVMPAFGGALSDDEIRAVVAYIKSTWPPDIRAKQPGQ